MDCVGCGSAAVTERPDLTAQGYRRFRCRDCATQFNERTNAPSIEHRCQATDYEPDLRCSMMKLGVG